MGSPPAKKPIAAISPTVSVIDTKARRSGKYHCRFDKGNPSFKPTEKSEISSATSATRSSIKESRCGSGIIGPHSATPRP